MDKLFDAGSVAVIGVSESDTNLGRYILENLVHLGYSGDIYPVGPRGGEVLGHRIFHSLAEVPARPDVAVILTPARLVPDIVRQCGDKGIGWAVIESGGFRELGPQGAQLEIELIEAGRKAEVRFVGPNCVGIANPRTGLYTPFVALTHPFTEGEVAVFAQSGGVGLSLAERASASGIGVSKMVSMGNKLSLDEADYLTYLSNDPETRVIYFYLEDFKRGRAFVDAARQCSKPIVLHKSNTCHLSWAIAGSHTAALASDDEVVDAICTEAGITRVHSVSQALRALKGLCLPPLGGNNLAVISRSGGHAVVAADACAKSGFNLPPLNDGLLREAEKRTRAGVIRLGNPLDLGDIFDLDFYFSAVEAALRQEDIHGVVFAQVAHMTSEQEATRRLIERLSALSTEYGKPVAVVAEVPLEERALLEKTANFPFFFEPAEAVQALAVQRRYREFILTKPTPVIFATEGDGVSGRVAAWMKPFETEKRQPLLHESLKLLDLTGIPCVPWQMVSRLEEALSAAGRMGYPVALKAVSPALLHKSDKGGIALNVQDAACLETEWMRLKSISADICGIVVQKMVSTSRELFVGAKRDPSFGPVVLVGMGGVMVEVIDDASMRLAPVGIAGARDMLDRLRCRKILGEFRGLGKMDLGVIADAVKKVSELIHCCPRIEAIDVNPIGVDDGGNGAVALDARVLLERDRSFFA